MKVYKSPWIAPKDYFWDAIAILGDTSIKSRLVHAQDILANAELGFAIQNENPTDKK